MSNEQNTGLAVEEQGIDIISEEERKGKPSSLFWPWFAANISMLAMSYGAWALGFGISFWQATLATIVGVVVSFLLVGVVSIAGKRGNAPTMVLTRATFGVEGAKVPSVLSWIATLGWGISLTTHGRAGHVVHHRASRPRLRHWPAHLLHRAHRRPCGRREHLRV